MEQRMARKFIFTALKSLEMTLAQWRRHGGDWGGTVPPLLYQVIFVNRPNPMRKICWWGDDVIKHIWIFA